MADKTNNLYLFGKFKDDFKIGSDSENVEDTFSARFQLVWDTFNKQFALEWDEWPSNDNDKNDKDSKNDKDDKDEEKERESGEEDSDSDDDNGFMRWQPEYYSRQFCGDAVIFEQHIDDDLTKPTEKFFIVGCWGRGSGVNSQCSPGRLFYKELPPTLPEGIEHLRSVQDTEFHSLFADLDDYCHKEYTEDEWKSDSIQPRYVNIRFSCKA